jgi:single-strand DNA-binding protein
MRGINKAILIGNASRDAELRHAQTGEAVSSLRLSTNRIIKGEAKTPFHAIVCWDRRGVTISTCVTKGHPLNIEGSLLPLPSRTRG